MAEFSFERLGLRHRVLQAGLGGGIAGARLAGAVSRAGGLGTVGIYASAKRFQSEIARARELAQGAPIAANLLLPFTTKAHVDACIEERVPVVSLFFGFDRALVRRLHEAGVAVLHQIGTEAEARRALRDGADGLIAQAEGAGGHLLAKEPLDACVPKLIALAAGKPVFAAGGIHDRASAARARALGAAGVVAGTRFVLCDESSAHPAYKQRLLEAQETLVTLLFGLGWPALHRVVPNAATERWCRADPLGPPFARAFNRIAQPFTRLARGAQRGALARQRIDRPFYTMTALIEGMDERLVDLTPLYAGACVAQIDTLRPAAEIVAELAQGADG